MEGQVRVTHPTLIYPCALPKESLRRDCPVAVFFSFQHCDLMRG